MYEQNRTIKIKIKTIFNKKKTTRIGQRDIDEHYIYCSLVHSRNIMLN